MKLISVAGALGILLALSPTLFQPPPSNTPQSQVVALPANRYWGIVSNLENDTLAAQAHDLGVGWIRLCIFWNRVEVSRGIYDWTAPDEAIHRAVANKLNLYITITGTPEWANGHMADNVPPNNTKDWANFVRVAVDRYRAIRFVRAYGLWNEPNLKTFWTGSRAEFVNKIFIPGALAVKEMKPGLLVGGPEMSHHWVDEKDWKLADILDECGSLIDVITQHVYADISKNPNGFAMFLDNRIKPLRGDKPVWITECGKNVCEKPSGQTWQNTYFASLLQAQSNRSEWFTKIFPYRLWDPASGCDSGNGFGLTYGEAMEKRSVYNLYHDYIKIRVP